MARDALKGCSPLLMTVETVAHLQIDGPPRNRLLPHISVACCALDLGPEVRRVIEPYVGGSVVVVDPLPGDLFTARHVGGNSPDFRAVRGNRLVARHTDLNAGNGGLGTALRSGVAILTFHAVRQIDFFPQTNPLNPPRAPR